MGRFNREDLTPEIVEGDILAWLKDEMRKGLDKNYLEEVLGPAIYGDGFFEVYQNDRGEWYMRPTFDFKPAVPKGLIYFQKE